VSVHPIRVLFPVTQRQLLDSRRDAKGGTAVVSLRLADGSIYGEKGKLDFLDVTVDPKTDTQIVRAVFDNQKGLLTDGQTLRVVLEGEKVPMVVAIPQAAIAIDQAGSYVFVVNDKSAVEQRRIKTSFSRDGLTAVTDGLKAGDKVIVQGQQRVRAGMTVKADTAPAAPSAKQQ
jgi:membrane fusion protein (multidrug efflux system)